jgi:hypothetical protein
VTLAQIAQFLQPQAQVPEEHILNHSHQLQVGQTKFTRVKRVAGEQVKEAQVYNAKMRIAEALARTKRGS